MLPSLPPRKLFLLDGSGALLSAFLLGVVLVRFEFLFGIPPKLLYLLTGVAILLAVYSLLCAFLAPRDWRPYLRGIAALNLTYCGLTALLLSYWRHQITVPGLLYFSGELLIVVVLAAAELKAAKAASS